MILTKVRQEAKKLICLIYFLLFSTGYGHKSHGYHDDHKGWLVVVVDLLKYFNSILNSRIWT